MNTLPLHAYVQIGHPGNFLRQLDRLPAVNDGHEIVQTRKCSYRMRFTEKRRGVTWGEILFKYLLLIRHSAISCRKNGSVPCVLLDIGGFLPPKYSIYIICLSLWEFSGTSWS